MDRDLKKLIGWTMSYTTAKNTGLRLVHSAVNKQKNNSLEKQNDRFRNIASNCPIEMRFYPIFRTQVNWVSSSSTFIVVKIGKLQHYFNGIACAGKGDCFMNPLRSRFFFFSSNGTRRTQPIVH